VTSEENQKAQGELSSALSRLISLTENYPELKSNQNVEQLMVELSGSENRIFGLGNFSTFDCTRLRPCYNPCVLQRYDFHFLKVPPA